MATKYIDTTAIMQVIGCVYNNPRLLDQTETYTITDEDFVEDFHKIIFGTIYKIYELGANEITLKNISDFLANRPKFEKIYKEQKGEEWLLKVSENAMAQSFDYYYSRLKKFSLLRAFDNCGIDVSEIYDPDNIFDIKRKQIQENNLDNATLQDLANIIDGKINEVIAHYVDNSYDDAVQAGDGIFDLIDKYKQYPEIGIPMYGGISNTVVRGARLKKFYLRSAATGIGKAIPNNTLIPTPIGWRRAGDIQRNDFLFGADGKPTRVIGVFPQKQKKKIWEVHFEDGRVAQCCGEHLWEYFDKDIPGIINDQKQVNDIETLYKKIIRSKYGFKTKKGLYRYTIRNCKPVDYKEKELPMNPYAAGVFLGEEDEDTFVSRYISDEAFRRAIDNAMGYKENVRRMDHDYVKYPSDFFIDAVDPIFYDSSINQRLELLRGLLDVAGEFNEFIGLVTVNFRSEESLNSIIPILHSLGIKYKYFKDNTLELYCRRTMKLNIFSDQNICAKISNYYFRNQDTFINEVAITNIEETEEYASMVCFAVDNPDHLFLMNDYIVTHNTRSLIADACIFSCEKYFVNGYGWIDLGSMQPTLYITTEQEKDEIQSMLLSFISNVNEDHILDGRKYEGDEEDRVREAARVISNAPLYLEELPDFSLKDIEDTIKRNVRERKIKYVCMDYIHTSMKILEEITKRSGGVKLREDNILFMISTKLKDICNQYGIFIISATQLNGEAAKAETLDQNLLRGAKSIADKIDVGMLLMPVKDEDYRSLESVLQTGIFERPVIKLCIYKNRRGRYKNVILWCKADLGCCRIDPIFCTTYDYELININETNITVKQESAF